MDSISWDHYKQYLRQLSQPGYQTLPSCTGTVCPTCKAPYTGIVKSIIAMQWLESIESSSVPATGETSATSVKLLEPSTASVEHGDGWGAFWD